MQSIVPFFYWFPSPSASSSAYVQPGVAKGDFYGRLEATLMSALIARHVYAQLDHYDFRTKCEVRTTTVNSASPAASFTRLRFAAFDFLSTPWMWMGKTLAAVWANVRTGWSRACVRARVCAYVCVCVRARVGKWVC